MPGASAFSPGSVSCFFAPRPGPTAAETVSRGCAINLASGVTATVAPARATGLRLGGQALEMPPVADLLGVLAPEPVRVELESELPIGCGFGVSAAAVLATAFALEARFELGRTRAELGLLAHAAEVRHRTGFGDVGSQLCGGVVHRRCERGPLDCERLPVELSTLHYRVYGPLPTAAILGSDRMLERILREGEAALAWLAEHRHQLAMPALLARSREFAERVGLVSEPRVRSCLEQLAGAGEEGTMISLGHTVVATAPLPGDGGWTAFEVDQEGTRFLP